MTRFAHPAVTAVAAFVFCTISTNAQGLRMGQSWGTYVHQMQLGPGMAVPVLITIHIDGTLTGAPGIMLSGVPGSAAKFSQVFGVWQRTGWNSIATTGTSMVFDDTTGVLTGFLRSRSRIKYSSDFNSYKAEEYLETMACASPLACDPLDPKAVWVPFPGMPATGFPAVGTRLEVMNFRAVKP